MYKFVDRSELIEKIEHIRKLHRQTVPASEHEQVLFVRRERKVKDLLSNLRRTGEHPMLNAVMEFGEMYSLTVGGAHQLFGYNLDEIRDYDQQLNAARTHIERSHQRLRPREIHRSLSVSNAGEKKRKQRGPCGPHSAEQGLSRKESLPSRGKRSWLE